MKKNNTMIVTVSIDIDTQESGVIEVRGPKNFSKLMPMGGALFLSMIFKQLSERYKQLNDELSGKDTPQP